MNTSDSLKELGAALAAAQAEMTGAKRDSENPFFKSKYADLASVREACLPALNKHGLSVCQLPRLVSGGEGAWIVEVETLLLHSSGEWLRDTIAVPVTKADAQGVGSAITYARRYALGALAGVASEDDDGNAASKPAPPKVVKRAPEGFDDWMADMEAIADEGIDAFRDAWKKSAKPYRDYLAEPQMKAAMDRLKARAQQAAGVAS